MAVTTFPRMSVVSGGRQKVATSQWQADTHSVQSDGSEQLRRELRRSEIASANDARCGDARGRSTLDVAGDRKGSLLWVLIV